MALATSQNGWAVQATVANLLPLPWITGRVLQGATWTVFDYVCRRWDAEVERIDPTASWGWVVRSVRGSTAVSNHSSGTAIDLNAPAHPLARRGTFSAAQVAAIHRILADCSGVVRWGGDYAGRVDEMHLEIVGTPIAVQSLAARIRRTAASTTSAPETSAPVAPAPTSTHRRTETMIDFVANLYRAYLDAEPSPWDLLNWSKAAETNGWTLTQMEAVFLSSPVDPRATAAAYQALLGRAPSAEDLTFWAGAAGTIAGVWAAVRGSDEAKARVA